MVENKKIIQQMNKPNCCFIEEKIVNIDKVQLSTIGIHLRGRKESKNIQNKKVINIKRVEILKIIRHHFAQLCHLKTQIR